LDKDDTSDSIKSGVYLPDEPKMFRFCKPKVFGDVKFASQGKGEEEEDHNGLEGEAVSEIEEVWQAITELNAKLKDMVNTLKINQVGIMDHLWSSIIQLGCSVESLHRRICGMEQDVGETAEMFNIRSSTMSVTTLILCQIVLKCMI
jgi:hypothetical protein